MWLINMEFSRDHRCEENYVAYKYKIFEAVNVTPHMLLYYFIYIHIYLQFQKLLA